MRKPGIIYCDIWNVTVKESSIHAYKSAILLHRISKAMFGLFNICDNSIYPGLTAFLKSGMRLRTCEWEKSLATFVEQIML